MKIRNPQLWATILDANPLPAGCSPNPIDWCAWCLTASADAREALHGAIVVIAAERWADAMERALEAGAAREEDLALLAVATLHRINREFGTFALTDFQVGCALTMLEQTWVSGERLRAALEVQLLEQLVLPPAAGRRA
jgi:hypothetical protein